MIQPFLFCLIKLNFLFILTIWSLGAANGLLFLQEGTYIKRCFINKFRSAYLNDWSPINLIWNICSTRAGKLSASTGLATALALPSSLRSTPKLYHGFNNFAYSRNCAGSVFEDQKSNDIFLFGVILAGGEGKRFMSTTPKQYLPLVGNLNAASISLLKMLTWSDDRRNVLPNAENSGKLGLIQFQKIVIAAGDRFKDYFDPVMTNRDQRVCFTNPGEERITSLWSAIQCLCKILVSSQRNTTNDNPPVENTEVDRGSPNMMPLDEEPNHVNVAAIERLKYVREFLKILLHTDKSYVFVHDAARPCFANSRLSALLHDAYKGGAALLSKPATSSFKLSIPGTLHVSEHLKRDCCFEATTPQVIRLDLLLMAFEQFFRHQILRSRLIQRLNGGSQFTENNYQSLSHYFRALQTIEHRLSLTTDDVALLSLLAPYKFKYTILLTPDFHDNMKITKPGDLEMAQCIIKDQLKNKTFELPPCSIC